MDVFHGCELATLATNTQVVAFHAQELGDDIDFSLIYQTLLQVLLDCGISVQSTCYLPCHSTYGVGVISKVDGLEYRPLKIVSIY